MPTSGVMPAQRATAAGARPVRAQDAVLDALVAATDDVTVEEFRLTEARVESDGRLGRRLLYLLSNTEWVRRTTEHVDVGRARVVDTEVVVDVDLSHLPPGVLDEDTVWLPLLAVPPPAASASTAASGTARQRDPVTSMEVTDAAGGRVSKATQAQVHRWLAPALAGLVLARLPGTRPDGGTGPTRDELVLLAAALRRLLPGTDGTPDGGPDGTGPAAVLDRGRAQVEERLIVARTGLLDAVRADLDRPRPVLRSRLVEMVAALSGVVHAVVPVRADEGPTSFAVRLPGRRLEPESRRRFSTSTRARLRVDLHAASPHSDRVVHVGLPDGIAVGSHRPAGARIELSSVRPVEELRALLGLVLDDEPEPRWVRRRLAGLAVDKVESSLEALQHLRPAPGDDDPAPRLRDLRARLLAVAAQDTAAPVDALAHVWGDGGWLPATYERRLVVNTATPGLVHVRASAIDGSAQRSTTGTAAVEAEVEVADSTVLDTARDTNAINAVLLAAATALVLLTRDAPALRDTWKPEILATVLTIFPAIQASRADRPDRSTLRGLLSQPTYLLSLAVVFPPVALAGALAAAGNRPEVGVVAVVALAVQVLIGLLLRRGAGAGGEPGLVLSTVGPPDLSRLDVLRGSWCRTLVSDALLLGRLTQGHLVAGPDHPTALPDALEVTLDGAGNGRVTSVHGLFHAAAAGRAVTFVLAGGQRAHDRHDGRDRHDAHDDVVRPGDRERHAPARNGLVVRHVPVEPGRLAAVEPPAWIVEAFIGLTPGRLDTLPVEDHPVAVLLAAARADDLPVLLVQTPALPPTYAAERRDWMRLRVGIPYLPGDDLGRLARYLTALDGLRARHPRRGAARVHTYAVPEFATHQGGLAAPDETDLAGRRTNDVLRDVRTDDVAVADSPGLQAFAVCAWARVGLAADVLAAAGATGPTRLAAMTSVVVQGISAQLVVVAPIDSGGPPRPVPDYAEAVRGVVHPRAVVEPVVARPLLPREPDDGRPRLPRGVARLQVRLPERPHALRDLLGGLAGTLGDLDTWFALFRVADGRTVQGRLMARVPPDAADAVRRLGSGAADAVGLDGDGAPARAGRAVLGDDPVAELAVLRTTAP